MSEETLQQLTEELEEIRRQRKERERLQRQIDQIKSERSEVQSRKRQQYKIIIEAEQEIDELESMSLERFYHSLFGDPKQEIQKHKEQIAEAKTRYESEKSTDEDLKEEINTLQARLDALDNLETRYDAVLSKKADQLKQMDHPEAEQLRAISEEIGELRDELEEIDEAIHAGSMLVSHVNRIKALLRSAQSWGRHDMVWGGVFVTMAKRGKMKKAEKLNRLTRQYARKFRREIEDLEQFSSHTTNLTGMSNFGGFIDYFLDGIFDIFIQQKINRALATTERKAGQLREKLGTLKGYADSVESEIQKKQEERKQIIQEA